MAGLPSEAAQDRMLELAVAHCWTRAELREKVRLVKEKAGDTVKEGKKWEMCPTCQGKGKIEK